MPKINAHDRVIFNGNDLTSRFEYLMVRPVLPPVEVSTETVGGRHGELFRRSRLQGFTVPVTIWFKTEDKHEIAEARHELAALLHTERPAPLYLPDDPTRYHLAIVDGTTEIDSLLNAFPSTTITFRVFDPIAYGNARTERLDANVTRMVDAGGTWAARPTVRSTTSGGTWRVTNVTTGEFVEVNAETVGGTVASGAALVCDMELERVTLNGNDVGVSIASDFFEIKGRCQLKVTGGTDTRLEWRERWL